MPAFCFEIKLVHLLSVFPEELTNLHGNMKMEVRKNPPLQVVQFLRHGDGGQSALRVSGMRNACKFARSKDGQIIWIGDLITGSKNHLGPLVLSFIHMLSLLILASTSKLLKGHIPMHNSHDIAQPCDISWPGLRRRARWR
jgi:hypothetical protein